MKTDSWTYGTPYFSQTALTRGCMFWHRQRHGHVREHVMFNLVVQPAVHEIVHVTTSLEVRRTNHRTKVEVIRSRLSLSLETVDVISDVVGGDDDEQCRVGDWRAASTAVIHQASAAFGPPIA